MQTDVTFRCDDGFGLPGVLTTPDGLPDGQAATARPGLLLIYEALGLTAEMARVARDLAGEGWTGLIPDLFARAATPVCVARCLTTVATGRGAPLDDLDAARRWLAGRPGVDAERMGVIGFCMGVGFALLPAMTGHYRAGAPFYGAVPKDMPRCCPVELVGSYTPFRLGYHEPSARDARERVAAFFRKHLDG